MVTGFGNSFSQKVVLAENISTTQLLNSKAQCLYEICFSESTAIGNIQLPIRGVAKKRYLIFDLYVAALYLPDNINTIDDILSETPKKMVFHYLRAIDGSDIIKAASKILLDNPKVNLDQIRSRLEKANSYYTDGVKNGDRFELEYNPQIGSTISKNGKILGTIEGSDFAVAYFGIWLSRYPLSEKFRDQLIKVRN